MWVALVAIYYFCKISRCKSGELLITSDFDSENGLRELLQIGLKEVAYELAGVSIENANYKKYRKNNSQCSMNLKQKNNMTINYLNM